MLQEPRGSPNLAQRAAEAEKCAAETVKRLEEFLTRPPDVVAYAGSPYPEAAANAFYWALHVLAPQAVTRLAAVEDVTYHILAYAQEPLKVLLFAAENTENMLARLGSAARATETSLAVVAPRLPDLLKARMETPNTYIAEVEAEPSLCILLSAYQAAARIIERSSTAETVRTARLRYESSNVAEVVEELLSVYGRRLEEAIEGIEHARKPVLIAYTTTMKPAALVATHSLTEKGYVSSTSPASVVVQRLKSISRVYGIALVYYTSVEEDLIRELKFKASMAPATLKLIELGLRTDPLTAPIYGVLLAEALRIRLKHHIRNALA